MGREAAGCSSVSVCSQSSVKQIEQYCFPAVGLIRSNIGRTVGVDVVEVGKSGVGSSEY